MLPLLQACSALNLFNTVAPKEKTSKLLKADIAYGEGPRRQYDVYAPVDMVQPAPVLVFFYGGGWSDGSKDSYAWAGRALAALGYVTILPDYRLVPEVKYPEFLDDCAAAVQHVIAHAGDYGGDASRLALMGHSAGAYNAAMLTLDPAYLGEKSPVKAFVGVSGPYDFYPFDVDASINAFAEWPRPEETQPISYARKLQTKFLLLYSLADKTVAPKNAINLTKALKAAGSDARTIAYKKPSHVEMASALSVPFRDKAPTLHDTEAFLAGVL
jgi:acetyl esterase/lipase